MAKFDEWIGGIGRTTRVQRSGTFPVPVGELERIVRLAVRRSGDLRVYELGPEGGTLYQRGAFAIGAGTVDLRFVAADGGSRVEATSHLSVWYRAGDDTRHARTLTRLLDDIAAVIADPDSP